MANKNKYGQYFTPSIIADFMVSLISHSKDCKILEPSCGKGIFLDHLINQGFINLSAYEIDKTLGTKYNFVNFVSFLSVPSSLKYDVIIGNPPYIRWKNLETDLKKELENNILWNKYFNSLCDYQFIFILKSIEHLTDGGELIFICTEYWLNSTHSTTLRNYICQKGYFTEIYHFKETPLFEKVTASFIIFKFIKSSKRTNTIKLFQYNKKGMPSSKELANRSCFDPIIIPHFKENKRWTLATIEEQEKLIYFEKACSKTDNKLLDLGPNRIGDYCDIGNGMVSGLDIAFQIKNIEHLNNHELNALIPVMKAKNLCPYKNKGISHYIFLQDKISAIDFEKKYPHFAEHFRPYLKKLTERYNYNKQIPYWEFIFPRNKKLFERKEDRIFVPCKERISNKNFFRFCYAPQGFYPTQDVTAILKKPNCRESIEYILAYLNNERVFCWLKLNGIIKGSIIEFSETPIANIPFRPINWNSKKEVEIHSLITEEIKNYITDSSISHINNSNNYLNELFNG